jgi:alpha-N-acetylglucosaminidase
LVSHFHLPRWELYFEAVAAAIRCGEPFDSAALDVRLLEWERAWSDNREAHSCTEHGETIEVSRELFMRYGANKPSVLS